MRVIRKKLKNGIRILSIPMKDNPTAAVLVMVGVGSHYEDKRINGISHFLEHMVFKGTHKRPKALRISHELDSLGANSNAFTWYEYTGYHAKSGAKNFSKILDVVSDMYLDPLFPQPELEKEKGVIIQEINLYEDQPMQDVHHVFDELLFGDQPAGRSVLGSKENIRRMKRDDFVAYRKKFYTTDATTVVLAGNIDAGKSIREAEKYFGSLKKSKRQKKPKIVITQKTPQVLEKYKDTDQSHFILGFRSFDANNKRNPTLDVLTAVLGRGMSSRLFQKLREEMGVCYYVRASNSEHTDFGTFKVSSGVDTKRTVEVAQVIMEEFRRLIKEKVPQDELNKAKEYICGNFLMGLESSDDVAGFFGEQEVLGLKLKTPEEIVQKIRKVTTEDIQKLAGELFRNERLNFALVGPNKNKARLDKILRV